MTFSPLARITLGLVLLTTGILLAGNLLGLTPDASRSTLEARQRFCESLAVQASLSLRNNDVALIRNTIGAMVERDPQILSGGLRKLDGTLVTQTRDHQQFWQHSADGMSTMTHVQVPIFQDSGRWGTVEISFTPLREGGLAGALSDPFIQLLLFAALAGCVVYYTMIKKVLRHLDPSAVIPGRVKAALDVLAEGVVLIDDRANIVLANAAFCSKIGVSAKSLLGMQLSRLHWNHPQTGEPMQRFPWQVSLSEGKNQTGIPICLTTKNAGQRNLMLNSASILDARGKSRGALITFDDVTQLEEKNAQLEDMLRLLQDSQDKVHQQNEELQILASRDPLTDCLNRRALFQAIDREIEAANRSGQPLSCVMCDIDYFKKINDAHGHIVGDEVIRHIAATLKKLTRDTDAVGRYGGEEFCILLPGMSLDKAAQIAERFRSHIKDIDIDGIGVTASFGVSALDGGYDAQELVQQADKALYQAKDNGRNQVVTRDGQQAA